MATIVSSQPSSLCSYGPRPLLLDGFLIQTLRQHFSSPSLITEKPLRDRLWIAGEATRNSLTIESVFAWRPASADQRPAILTRRNDWQVSKLGIGDLHQHGDDRSGAARYTVVMQGSITVFCLAAAAGEAEMLGNETYLELLEFSHLWRSQLDLLRCGVVQYGRCELVKETREHFGIPITMAFAHTHSWEVTPSARTLQHIDIESLRPRG